MRKQGQKRLRKQESSPGVCRSARRATSYHARRRSQGITRRYKGADPKRDQRDPSEAVAARLSRLSHLARDVATRAAALGQALDRLLAPTLGLVPMGQARAEALAAPVSTFGRAEWYRILAASREEGLIDDGDVAALREAVDGPPLREVLLGKAGAK